MDALKRLRPRYLTLWKWSYGLGRFLQYPDDIADDDEFFYHADFRLRRTEYTDPYRQELAAKLHAEEVKSPVNATIIDEVQKSRFEYWEKLGLERVKSDLVHTGGIRDVGGPQEQRDMAWKWVRMKEEEAKAAAVGQKPASGLTLIAETRLAELRALRSTQFDFKKLIRLCEELNIVSREECHFATAMLTRGLLDHVPPIFGTRKFSEVANNYSGGTKSFKDTMHHLETAARKVADAHLHTPIRKSETLPVMQQVNFAAQLDVLLAEIVRITQ